MLITYTTPKLESSKGYTISSTFTGRKPATHWNDKGEVNCNHHFVTVKNNQTGAEAQFDFWTALADKDPSKALDKKYNLLNALYCWIGDAIAGMETFEDFCSNFGYDTDSRKAEATWKACQTATAQAQRVITEDLYEFYNELAEVAA